MDRLALAVEDGAVEGQLHPQQPDRRPLGPIAPHGRHQVIDVGVIDLQIAEHQPQRQVPRAGRQGPEGVEAGADRAVALAAAEEATIPGGIDACHRNGVAAAHPEELLRQGLGREGQLHGLQHAQPLPRAGVQEAEHGAAAINADQGLGGAELGRAGWSGRGGGAAGWRQASGQGGAAATSKGQQGQRWEQLPGQAVCGMSPLCRMGMVAAWIGMICRSCRIEPWGCQSTKPTEDLNFTQVDRSKPSLPLELAVGNGRDPRGTFSRSIGWIGGLLLCGGRHSRRSVLIITTPKDQRHRDPPHDQDQQ